MKTFCQTEDEKVKDVIPFFKEEWRNRKNDIQESIYCVCEHIYLSNRIQNLRIW